MIVRESTRSACTYTYTPSLIHVTKIELAMERFCIDSCVRGYHVYSDIWSASVGEELPCEREDGNSADPFAVAIFCSLVPSLPDLFNASEKGGGAWYLTSRE